MNWTDFKTKYKNEIRVGVIVFISMMLIRLVKSLLNKYTNIKIKYNQK